MISELVALLIAFTAVAYVVGRSLKHRAGYVASVPIWLAFLAIASRYSDVLGGGLVEFHDWVKTDVIRITLSFLLDGISYPIALIILYVTALAAIYSVTYLEHAENQEAYYAYYMLYVAGMLGATLSMNLIQFFFFWELMLVPSYLLIAGWGYGERRRVAYKYFLYTQLGTILILLGILYLAMRIGSFEIMDIPRAAGVLSVAERAMLAAMLVAGFGVKMAIVPLHGWLPEAHAEAPTPISVILSGVMIEVGLYALMRIALPVAMPVWTSPEATTYLMALAVVSMIYGGIMAMVQTDVKRLLAYSSISQMGYMFLGVAAASAIGIEGSIFHVVNHGLLKGLLFMVAGVLIHQVGIRDMRRLGGLASKMPVTASLAVVGAMGIAGLPGIGSFISEYLIFQGCLASSSPYRHAMLILGVLATVISAGYMTLFVRRVFFGPLSAEIKDARDPPPSMVVPMAVMAVTAIVLGVYPSIVLKYILPGLSWLEGVSGLGG